MATSALASWANLEAENPPVAKIGSMLLRQSGRAFLATVRPGGGPRLHPLCPVIAEGMLIVGIITRSPKCGDLLRDGRYVLHALPGPGDAEFWVEGRSRCIEAAEGKELADVNPIFQMPPGNMLFELHLTRAYATIFESGPDDVPIPDRRSWHAKAMEGTA